MSSHKKFLKKCIYVAVVVVVLALAVCVYYAKIKQNSTTEKKQENRTPEVTESFPQEQNKKGCVIFLHSGGFVVEKNEYHEQFGKALGEQLGYDYLVPDYPIHQSYEETLAYMEDIYAETMKKYDSVLMIGCSAGANLAVSSMICYGEEYGMPDGLILMSPWLDTSMQNEEITCVSDFDKEFFTSLVEWGKQYNKGDTETPLASPVKVEKEQLKHFPDTVMVVGDQDILRFDAQKFQSKLEEADVKVTYLTAEGKNHGEVFAEYAATYMMPEIMNEALKMVMHND